MEENPKGWKGKPLDNLREADPRQQWPALDETRSYWPPEIPPPPVVPKEAKTAPLWGRFNLKKDMKKAVLGSMAGVGVVTGCAQLPDIASSWNSPTNSYSVAVPIREARGTVVIDLGHGNYMGTNEKGEAVQKDDPGARVVLKSEGGKTTLRTAGEKEQASDLRHGEQMVREVDITEAMGARMALQLVARGYSVRFTRHIDLENNPYLKDLNETERTIIKALNNDVKVLGSRFNARIEQAHAANDGKKPVMYVVLHADMVVDADNNPKPDRRGAGVFINPNTPTDSASYRLSKSLQENFRDAPGGTLGPNVKKGVIPGQDGFGALFTIQCAPEIGLGTRNVTIISPKPTKSVVRGLEGIPASLIELGYLSNPSDTYRLRSPEWASNLARAAVDGIDTFFTKEYETKKPLTLETPPVKINGVTAEKLPADPQRAASMVASMTLQANTDPKVPMHVRTKEVTYCKPSGVKFTEHYAAAVAGKAPPPKATPAPKTQVAKVEARRADTPKPETAKKKAPDKPRSHVEVAKGKEGPRSRS